MNIFLSFLLSQLGKNKRVQDKLRDEINRNADKDGIINFETLQEMPYLDQVFNETLRMHPPAVMTSRICTEAIELEFEGQKAPIEEGLNVFIPIHQLHYDPEYYPDPEEFKPERFDPENGGIKAFKDKGVYLPFGDGPRMCLGMRFAQIQSKGAIVSIVKNFEISINDKTPKEQVIDPKEFLNVKVGGFWVDFKLIKSN